MKDAQNLFSDAQAITASAASTNFLNLGTPETPPGSPAPLTRDIGGGNNQPLLIEVTETFAGATSLEVSLEVDDNSSFSSAKTVGTTGAIPVADLVQGKILPLNMVPVGADEQYMRLQYTVAGGPFTAGSVVAGLVTQVHTNG